MSVPCVASFVVLPVTSEKRDEEEDAGTDAEAGAEVLVAEEEEEYDLFPWGLFASSSSSEEEGGDLGVCFAPCLERDLFFVDGWVLANKPKGFVMKALEDAGADAEDVLVAEEEEEEDLFPGDLGVCLAPLVERGLFFVDGWVLANKPKGFVLKALEKAEAGAEEVWETEEEEEAGGGGALCCVLCLCVCCGGRGRGEGSGLERREGTSGTSNPLLCVRDKTHSQNTYLALFDDIVMSRRSRV